MQALTQPQGGISASIASSTFMNADAAAAFMGQLIRNANARSGQRWGSALMRAQQWSFGQTGSFYQDLGTTEQLLGDPAMPVFAPARSASATKSAGESTTSAGTF